MTQSLPSTENYLMSCTGVFFPDVDLDKVFIVSTPPLSLNADNVSTVLIGGVNTIIQQKW